MWDAMRCMADRVELVLTAVQARLSTDFPVRTAEAVFEEVRTQLKCWQRRAGALNDR